MKVWIVSIFLLLLAGIAVWVVVPIIFSNTASKSPYEIPAGRYDYYMMANNLNKSAHFPDVRSQSGPMPRQIGAAFEGTEEYLGRKFTIGVYHADKDFARQVTRKAFARIEKIAAMADPAVEDSLLSRINHDAANRPVVLTGSEGEDLYALLKRALDICEKSGGKFDITAGPLRKLFSEYGERGQTPPADEINQAREFVGYKFVQLGENAGKHVVKFTKPGVTIDLHDVIGGFCLDQAAYALRLETIASAYLNVGDCWRLLDPPNAESGRLWTLGVPDPNPAHPGMVSVVFQCGPGAACSKGYYSGFRFTVTGSSVITDIIDPTTGGCVGGIGVCTLIGPDALSCDAMCTAAVVKGPGEVDWFLKSYNPPEEEKEKKKPATEETP